MEKLKDIPIIIVMFALCAAGKLIGKDCNNVM